MSRASSNPLLSSLGIVALAGAVTPMACRDNGGGTPPINGVEDVLDVYQDFYAFYCECYAELYAAYGESGGVDECISQLDIADDAEIACLANVIDSDPEARQIVRCQGEALRTYLSCLEARGCPGLFTCGDGASLPEEAVCDGFEQCEDGSDEDQGCPPPFTCGDGQELQPYSICDGFADCADESDEANCPDPFVCSDGTQLPPSWICDGVGDCLDGADEQQNCPVTCESQYSASSESCGEFSDAINDQANLCFDYTCEDGSEVPGSKRCDGTADCPGGDDELFCDDPPVETTG